jgi:hypothetical protein
MNHRLKAAAFLLGASLVALPALAQPAATPSWSADGRLEDSDSQDGDRRYDDHRLTLEAGRRYQISASSDDFDTVIRLYRAGADEPVATNDDYGGSFNSRLVFTPEAAGEYRLRVLAYSGDGRGAYRAEAGILPPLPPAAQVPQGRGFEGQGRLESAPTQPEGADQAYVEPPYAEHRLQLEAGRRYRFSASSEDFDTQIQLVRESDESVAAENDDYGEGLNSRVSFASEESGIYSLRVRSVGGNGGAYRVGAELLPPLPAPNAAPAGERAQTVWHIWQGELSSSDPDNEGQYFDDYLVRMRAGETRLVIADADGFDTTVAVLPMSGRNGQPLYMDDDSGPGVNSLLAFQASEDGDYVVRVSSFSAGAAGAYRLRISEPVTPPLPAEAGPADLGMDDHSGH